MNDAANMVLPGDTGYAVHEGMYREPGAPPTRWAGQPGNG